MSGRMGLSGLVIEDDAQTLAQMLEYLPESIDDIEFDWEGEGNFEAAIRKLRFRRYDLVITDVYTLPATGGEPTDEDNQATNIVDAIRKSRMCPLIVYSSRAFQIQQSESPFVVCLAKDTPNDPILTAISSLLNTGIPQIARQLHEELDMMSGPGYLWQFLENNWDAITSSGMCDSTALARLVRKRAALQFSRIDRDAHELREIKHVCAADFYIMPPIAQSLRLGEIVRSAADNRYHAILTPHCFLEHQPNAQEPRAEFVLLAECFPFSEMAVKVGLQSKLRGSKREENLRKMLQAPARMGTPDGRYWFLPGFLKIPDMLCDLMQIRSVPLSDLQQSYERLAVLDVPFAESLQSCFTRLYSSIGVPPVDIAGFNHLYPLEDADVGT